MNQKIFENFGCVVLKKDDRYLIQFDSGESAGSKTVEYEINESEMKKAQLSEQDAYEVILKCQNRLNQRD